MHILWPCIHAESSSGHHSSSARLPERSAWLFRGSIYFVLFSIPSNLFSNKTSINRVKLIIEEIEREEAALRQELYSADRKFAEYYNVYDRKFVLFYPFCQRLIAQIV